MAGDDITIRVTGLREATGRFSPTNPHLRQHRNEMLTAVAQLLKDRIAALTPRSTQEESGGPHLADLWHVSTLAQADGPDTASITISNPKEVTTLAGQSYSLAQLLITGTRPHDIYPVTGTALHFVVGGAEMFAGMVHHPGTTADPFVERAIDDTDLRPTLQTYAARVATDLGGER